jgi:DNA (cytosine-5)-methyltransferase 1
MRLLDLFCGAGGCAVGYHRAGFDVVGVDIAPQPNYPFEFIQGDALEYARAHGHEFDAVHASPPCQRYSTGTFRREWKDRHPDLIAPVRGLLQDLGRPWVIENVGAAPLSPGAAVLCGLMFGLKVFRHRSFESSFLLMAPPHPSHKGKVIGRDGMRTCVGNSGCWGSGKQRRRVLASGSTERDDKPSWVVAMGIDWMTIGEMREAIPPAYTEFVGRQLIALCGGAA